MLYHGQDFFTRRSNSNKANSRNSSHSLCRTKSSEHISEKFDEFDAIKETVCKDIDSLLERREDLDVKLTCIIEKLDDIEQYSRRNCILFTGIVEKDDENADLLILDACREGMGIKSARH